MNANVHILYVEDDETIAFLTRDNLEMRGYRISHAKDGREALQFFSAGGYDLCLVDIMLPILDGFSFAREVRKHDLEIPILFLSAKSLTDDKLKGFKLGADDYITKPFNMDELVMRIEVFLKRKKVGLSVSQSLYRTEGFEYTPDNQSIRIHGKGIGLTYRENELLHFLCRNPNTLVRREDILMAVWGNDDYFLGRSLDVFISRLRKILKRVEQVSIETVHSVGFRFIMPPQS